MFELLLQPICITVVAFPSKLDIQRVRKVMLDKEQVITFW